MGEDDIYSYLEDLKSELNETKEKNNQLNTAISSTSYQNVRDDNIHIQLESNQLLERIEHFLRGDILTTDEDGNQFFERQKDLTLVFLNEDGVNSIMLIISSYVDKIHSLSYYSEERIYEICGDLGDELATFIFCNYERIGMDTHYKKSRYKLIVLTILNMVESNYRKALKGLTSENINSSKIYMPNSGNNQNLNHPRRSRWNWLNPSSWF